MKSPSLSNVLQKLVEQFDLSDQVLDKISHDMQSEFDLGLQRGSPASSVAMLPSFVPALPDGTESGKYIAIDLSGKNLRIMLLILIGNGTDPEVVNHNYLVHESVMKGTGEQLFTFIVNCLQKFLTELDLLEANLPVGFVFSYPCELVSIRSARLLWWTKGFDIKDCLQKDVVQLLENALELNMSIKARIKVVMNDTVGQLASAAYKYGPDTLIGVVIGYGCNSSYLEETKKITKLNADNFGYTHPHMVVVTEWEEFGALGELESILTTFDREIDNASVHKGKQIVDKLTGALYLGELVRRILAQLTIDGVLFDGKPCEKLDVADSFPTKYISEILGEEEGSFKICRRICDELDISNHGGGDYLVIRQICHTVSMRSASIVAAAISALLRHMNKNKVKIGVGGALIQFHPTYHKLLELKLKALAPKNVEWQIVAADEGSATGAALLAAVVDKLQL